MAIGGSSRKVMACQPDEARRIRALVVDDDHTVRMLHETLLTKYGLETQAAENGREAVNLFLRGETFDLVLMDMEMPVMDGPKATRLLRGMGVSSMIVGVTGGTAEAEIEAFMKSGLDFCWEKPLVHDTVIAILDELAMKLL